MSTIKKIGFIGVGNMGNPMAANLLKGGFEVTVFDARAETAAAFVAQHGGKAASSLSDLARGVDAGFDHFSGPDQSDPKQKAQAKQAELEKNTPQLKVTEETLRLNVPGQTIGETVGVAKNSQGHLFVFSRTGKTATVKGSALPVEVVARPELPLLKVTVRGPASAMQGEAAAGQGMLTSEPPDT